MLRVFRVTERSVSGGNITMNYYEEYKELIQKLVSGDFSQATQHERDTTVIQIIHASALTSAMISIIPVPLIETPIQITMVRGIGKVYERA